MFKQVFWGDVDQKVGTISGLIGVIAISIITSSTWLPLATEIVNFWKEALSSLLLF